MNIKALLQGRACACGRHHSCPIREVFVEHGAIGRLKELCAPWRSVLVVADENTYRAAGERTVRALGDKLSHTVIFDGGTLLIPNEDAIERVRASLGGIELIVGIGSGVIQDLCKYVAHTASLPYMIVATAPSMDGYASDGAAMILGGMKETVPATLPVAIVADTEVLRDAPIEMIRAGFGDIIGKYSALCDWRLSHAVLGEYFCDFIHDTTMEMLTLTRKHAKGIMARDEESIRVLAEALVVVGIMMSYATSSRPASGSEHHLSHYFEISGIIENAPYFPHGIDVAYSTVITAELREKLLARPLPDAQYSPERQKYVDAIFDSYKSQRVAEGCLALQRRAGFYGADRMGAYRGKYEEIRQILASCPSSRELCEIFREVGLDMKDFYALYGEEKIKKAILWGKDLKNRYTVLWMHFDLQEER